MRRHEQDGSSTSEVQGLLALYHETWAEITRLRDYEWRITYYFVSLSGGIMALVVSGGVDRIISYPLRWAFTVIQIAAASLGLLYIRVTHGYLTEQRNIRRRIEETLGLYDAGKFGPESPLPAEWKGQRITTAFQRLGLVVPLMLTVLLAQGLSIYLTWSVKGGYEGATAVESRVSFRYVGVKTERGEIPGICLSYPDEETAKAVFSVLREYLTSPADYKRMDVVLSRQAAGTYSLGLNVDTGKRSYAASIVGIDSSHVEKIKELLSHSTYYLIVAGYQRRGHFCLLPMKEFHLFKRDIVIDGETLLGSTACDIDWLSVFDA
jgi:hypothetical protein